MNAGDYQKLKDIFQSAVEMPPDERPDYLDEKCNGDNELRAEVQRLLDSYESGFLENPAAGELSAGFTGDGLESGGTIGHYTIVRKIGSGGMGEVYLAEDGKLGRKVAIKLLPETFTEDEDRLRRFEQEARTASALNHPNILTIHEIGETGNTKYIATEYIEGETLRARLNRGPLSVTEALEIAIQCASALAAAHESGIIHRDIKPENIMLRRDNLVKLLDFGLAKLAIAQVAAGPEISHDAPTERHVRTAPGVIMGTVQYMSPEQTRGHATDARTDIWSMGVVLHEMVAGSPPFAGETTADLIAEIVKTYPIPLSQSVEDIPERLDAIVAKTLEKDPDERYQTVNDLIFNLKRVKRNSDLEGEASRWNKPTVGSAAQDSSTDEMTRLITADDRRGINSSEGHFATGAGRIAVVSLLSASLLLAVSLGVWLIYQSDNELKDNTGSSAFTLKPVTGEGQVADATISGDGRLIAYIIENKLGMSLWVKQISTNSNIKLVNEGEMERYEDLNFTPDNSFVFFTATNKVNTLRTIFRVPTFGGNVSKVISDAGRFSFSPDGRDFAFHRRKTTSPVEDGIWISSADGSNQRHVFTEPMPRSISDIAWSPDGKFFAYPILDRRTSQGLATWIEIFDNVTGEKRALGGEKWFTVRAVAWASNPTRVIVEASDTGSEFNRQIWEIGFPSGEARRLTQSSNNLHGTSVTSDGRSIVSVEIMTKTSIWVSPDSNIDNTRQVITSRRITGFDWTPEGNIVFVGANSGNLDVWKMKPDGSDTVQLTKDEPSTFKDLPRVSPDGKLVFYSSGNSTRNIWQVDIDGSESRRLSDGDFEYNPMISGDGRLLVYNSAINGRVTLRQITLPEGGPSTLFLDSWALGSNPSPDGGLFACFVYSDKGTRRIGVFRFADKQQVSEFEIPQTVDFINGVTWTPDAKYLVYIDKPGGIRNLWLQPLSGGPARQFTHYEQNGVFQVKWSKDGTRVGLVRGERTSDAVLISAP